MEKVKRFFNDVKAFVPYLFKELTIGILRDLKTLFFEELPHYFGVVTRPKIFFYVLVVLTLVLYWKQQKSFFLVFFFLTLLVFVYKEWIKGRFRYEQRMKYKGDKKWPGIRNR